MSYVTYLALTFLPCVITPVNNLQAPVKFTVNAITAYCQYFTVKFKALFYNAGLQLFNTVSLSIKCQTL